MSMGLLRGLAARALGLDAPLRSQRVRSFEGLSTDPTPAVEPTPLAPPPQAAPWQQPVAPISSMRGNTDTGVAALDTSAAGSRATAPGAVVRRQADEPIHVRDGPHPPASPLHRDPAPVPPPTPFVAAQDAAAAAPQPEHHAPQPTTNAPAPRVRTIQVELPAPLLPLSAPARLPPPAASVSTPAHRGQASRTAAAEAPTEVHVSIGRVELTALAPTTGTRTPARREAPTGRSLADYLRGPGGKRPT